mgnify:CR=1 FL=1
MLSDHFPISASFFIKTGHDTIIKKKTDWSLYTFLLDKELNKQHIAESLEPDYNNLVNAIISAESAATKTSTKKVDCKTLPSYILDIINCRKETVKNLRKDKFNNSDLKPTYNFLTKLIKSELKAYRELLWTRFCNSLNTTRKNTKEYWDKIKSIGHLETKKPNHTKRQIPILVQNDVTAYSGADKAQMFGQMLKKNFLK